jgi:hypothetical protein
MHSTLVVEEQYTYSSTKYACINSPQLNEVVDSLRVLLAISTRTWCTRLLASMHTLARVDVRHYIAATCYLGRCILLLLASITIHS